MDRIAVFVDDSEHARRILYPYIQSTAQETEWLVVACAPRLPHRVSRWLTREQCSRSRLDWVARLRSELEPTFGNRCSDSVEWLSPTGRLALTSDSLRSKYGTSLRMLDARKGRPGRSAEPILQPKSVQAHSEWGVPVAIASSLSLMLALTD